MPFTFAHPAIVLPLNYCSARYVSLTGLVAGSIAPDFEYFLRMRVEGIYGHTLTGMFWFDLPLAILLAFLFHNIIRNQLIFNLPAWLAKRLQGYTTFNWNKRFFQSWFIIIISILTGTGSHLLWDGFTHEHGFFVDHLIILNSQIGSVPLYKLLQHISSLAGMAVITWSLKQLPVGLIYKKGKQIPLFWSGIFIITSIIVLPVMLFAKDGLLIGNVIVSVTSSFFIALIGVTYFFNLKNVG